MKFVRCGLTALFAIMGCVSLAHGQVVVDGLLDVDYGAPIAIQSVQTQFGDNESEWNAAYAHCANDRLYLMFTGNIDVEGNGSFNKLEIFFDSVAGGENTLSATPEYDFGNTSVNLGGMTFDNGFNADYHMYVRGGDPGGGSVFDVDFANRAGGFTTQVASNGISTAYDTLMQTASGTITSGDLSGNASGATLTDVIDFGLDNSNILGIGGGTGAADPVAAAAVTTGFEFSIALADLGLDPTVSNTIRIALMQNNSDHNYLSNQTLAGLAAGTGNLGGDGAGGFIGDLSGIDFNTFAGNQFMTLNLDPHTTIPEPGATGVVLLIGLLGLTRRRS